MIPIVVQNKDVNLTQAAYSHLCPDQLYVHGTFYTVQGEGPLAGKPAWFIRLAGCNFGAKEPSIACSFCDTAFRLEDSTVRTIESLCEEFEVLTQNLGFTPAVVITGGEPLLQKNVVDLITTLLDPSEPTYVPRTQVQIETNGSQVPVLRNLLDTFYADDDLTVVISPKTVKGSYGKEKDYGSKHGYYYKFVVSADPENPHHVVPDWAPRSRTYVSPMTVYKRPYQGEVSSVWDNDLIDVEATKANYAYAAKLSMERGYTVSVQMHTFLNIA